MIAVLSRDQAIDAQRHAGVLALLEGDYGSREAAAVAIRGRLAGFYRSSYAALATERAPAIEAAAEALVGIYSRNIFPAMKITWGTYPNNLGHENSPGCFRCHDGSHISADGRTIASDCDTCHTLVAVDDPNPEVLKQLSAE